MLRCHSIISYTPVYINIKELLVNVSPRKLAQNQSPGNTDGLQYQIY
jgi:hypothetical protein